MPAKIIRNACEADCAGIARLATQLGYPASANEIRPRLQRVLASGNDVVFVAESGGELAGWIHGFLSQLLESNHRVEIGGLVVDASLHRQGFGRELVRRVEDWARERGVTELSVRCRTTRPEAHQFYERLGYRAAKTQIAFRKQIA